LSPRSSVLSPRLPEGLQQLQRGSRLLAHPTVRMTARAASGTPEEVSVSSFSVTRRRSEDAGRWTDKASVIARHKFSKSALDSHVTW
jgi:hypothetical protein